MYVMKENLSIIQQVGSAQHIEKCVHFYRSIILSNEVGHKHFALPLAVKVYKVQPWQSKCTKFSLGSQSVQSSALAVKVYKVQPWQSKCTKFSLGSQSVQSSPLAVKVYKCKVQLIVQFKQIL